MNGMDNLFSGMRIAASGLTAERVRIDTIAENIANARTTSTPEGGPYRRKMVVFEPMLRSAIARGGASNAGVRATKILRDFSTNFQLVHEEGHPDADANGMVEYPNVNTVIEMSDLITALRAYEANITVQENFIRMAERALQMAQ